MSRDSAKQIVADEEEKQRLLLKLKQQEAVDQYWADAAAMMQADDEDEGENKKKKVAPSVMTSEVYNEAELLFTMMENKEKLVSFLDCTTLLRGMGMNPTNRDMDVLRALMAEPVVKLEHWRREEELRRDREKKKDNKRGGGRRRGAGASFSAGRKKKSVAATPSKAAESTDDMSRPASAGEAVVAATATAGATATDATGGDGGPEGAAAPTATAASTVNANGTTHPLLADLTAAELQKLQLKVVPAEEIKNIDWNIFISCVETLFRDRFVEQGEVHRALTVFDRERRGKMKRDELVRIITTNGECVLTPAEVKVLVDTLPEECSLQELAERMQGTYVPPTEEELERMAAEEEAKIAAEIAARAAAASAEALDPLRLV